MSELSLAQLLKSATEKLPDSDSASFDARLLLANVLNVNCSYFYTWPDKIIAPALVERFEQLIARRQQGEPVAYLIGQQEFWSLMLKVSPATLIPRPETELLVELVLEHVKASQAVGIDLGTGTGAIALALASEQPHWQLLGVDFNQQAVSLAQTNQQQLAINNVEFIQSSWLTKVALSYHHACDFIVSNPPYIDGEDPHLSAGDVRFEPKSALVAAQNGFQDIIDITKQSLNFLKPKGILLFEHGFEQGAGVRKILSNHGFNSIVTLPDLAGHDRVTLGFSA